MRRAARRMTRMGLAGARSYSCPGEASFGPQARFANPVRSHPWCHPPREGECNGAGDGHLVLGLWSCSRGREIGGVFRSKGARLFAPVARPGTQVRRASPSNSSRGAIALCSTTSPFVRTGLRLVLQHMLPALRRHGRTQITGDIRRDGRILHAQRNSPRTRGCQQAPAG
jgi:hypothetical protein